MITSSRRGLATLAAALAAGPHAAFAQGSWPQRPATLVVPFPPGGSNDVVARLFAQQLSRSLGQPFVVENRPGANGNIGASQVARAAPDGYTLLVSGNGQNAMNHGLYAQMPYDSRTAFAHVALLANVPNALVVSADFPARSMAEFFDLARRQRGQLSYASPGTGSSGHLAMAMLQHAAGFELVHVPYRGAAPAITDVLAGQVPVVMINVDIPLAHVRAGRLRVLAVTSRERSALYPEAPTIAESGVTDFSASGWMGISAPVGTPGAIVERLHGAVAEATRDPALRERADASGYVLGNLSSQQYAAFISSEIDKWGEVIRATGARLE
jgi:tripartite-type tricarboxylate transporter receptor subunit TctC